MDKIVCLGKNYSEHAKEMGEAAPAKPVLFIKPPSVLACSNGLGGKLDLSLPKGRGQVHHECELVLRLGTDLRIDAVTVGLDMTLRDVQAELKKNGQPWTISKVFKDSAIVGPWMEINLFSNWMSQEFQLEINGEVKQKSSPQEMILKTDQMFAYIQQFFPVCPGDLIFTGTPRGVGPVKPGDEGRLKWGPIAYEVRWL